MQDEAIMRAYAAGYLAGHACGVFEPELSGDDVFGAAAHQARAYVADDIGQIATCDPAFQPELVT